jgi:hypothetical protein
MVALIGNLARGGYIKKSMPIYGGGPAIVC